MDATNLPEHLLWPLAASGDVAAQRALTKYALRMPIEDPDIGMYEALVAAEMLARFTVQHGGTADKLTLADVLLRNAAYRADSHPLRASEYQAEALSLLNAAADSGCEEAVRRIQAVSANGAPPHILARAKEITQALEGVEA